jgi:hypothetical protein
MTTRLATVLSTVDLPLAELCSARIDGELFAIGDVWCPIDQPDGARERAQAAASMVPAKAISERFTAAWIFGGAPEPRRHQFCVDTSARAHVAFSTRYQLREVTGITAETIDFGGASVTTPRRTVVDLARTVDTGDDDVLPVLVALLGSCVTLRGDTVERHPLLQNGRQYAALALGRIQRARAQLAAEAAEATEDLAVAYPVHVIHRVDATHGVQHTVEVGGVPHLEHEPAERQAVA